MRLKLPAWRNGWCLFWGCRYYTAVGAQRAVSSTLTWGSCWKCRDICTVGFKLVIYSVQSRTHLAGFHIQTCIQSLNSDTDGYVKSRKVCSGPYFFPVFITDICILVCKWFAAWYCQCRLRRYNCLRSLSMLSTRYTPYLNMYTVHSWGVFRLVESQEN